MAKKFIQAAIKHPGALHAQMGIPQGQKIPTDELIRASHMSGKEGQRARLALTLRRLGKS